MKYLSIILLTFIFQSFANTPKLNPVNFSEIDFEKQKRFSGGSITSVGGGDTFDLRTMSAWFHGNEPITTCISYNSILGVEQTIVEDEIRNAIKAWQDYFEYKRVNDFIPNPINNDFDFVGECKGGEELVLFFGTGIIFGNLRDLRAQQKLNNPVAYINKTHISEDGLRSKGYIRFVEHERYSTVADGGLSYPNWNIEGSLLTMIIHELGHVLGFKHTKDTVMDGSIAYELFFANQENDIYSIDHEAVLFPNLSKLKRYKLSQSLKENNFLMLNNIISITKNSGNYSISANNRNLNMISFIEEKQELPLYTNFQTRDLEYDQISTLYTKLGSDLISFHLKHRSLTVYINGEPTSIYEEMN